jgi:hypothetical protein
MFKIEGERGFRGVFLKKKKSTKTKKKKYSVVKRNESNKQFSK